MGTAVPVVLTRMLGIVSLRPFSFFFLSVAEGKGGGGGVGDASDVSKMLVSPWGFLGSGS